MAYTRGKYGACPGPRMQWMGLTTWALALSCVLLWAPIAPGQPTSATSTPPPTTGATVVVRMIDAVDSSSNPAGRQFRAVVAKLVKLDNNVIIAPGSVATVVLIKDSSGWSVQLSSVVINGQVVPVTSGPASLLGAAQNDAARAENAVKSALGVLGRKPNNRPSPPVAVAAGERVILPPRITLSFVLNANPPSNAVAPAAVSAPAGSVPTPAAGPLSANVKETILGPNKPAGLFVVSPDGGHIAISSMHGSREIIVLDGVDGPEFDHAGHLGIQAIDVAFSPDGKRSAYVAQHGDNWVAVVNGKEAYTLGSVSSGLVVQGIDQSFIHDTGDKIMPHQFLISQSGAHVACVTQDRIWHVFLDGVKSPDYNLVDLRQVAFAGEKLMYAAQAADQKWHMVVNDKPGPAYDFVASLLLSDDNQHYAFVAGNGINSMVVADGVSGTPRPKISGTGIHNLVIASNGRVAYLGYSGTGPNGTMGPFREPLYVGDQQVSLETSFFASTYNTGAAKSSVKIVFSPDGKKFAYAKPVPGGIAAIIDGKQGIAYDGIGLIQFSPDSRRAFFVGLKNVVLNFVVIDGQEMPGQNVVKNFVFSQDGSRFGYEAYSAQDGFSMVVDGKQSGKFQNLIERSLAFSSDGKHSVYAACTQFGHCQVVEDGTVTNVPGLTYFQTRMAPHMIFPPVLFSPDGSRHAYAYPKPDGTSMNVIVINGQEILHGNSFSFRSFSPDSKHFATFSWTGKGYSVLVDGKIGPTFDDIIEANPNSMHFEDSHTLRFLGIRGDSVYLVTVDIGG